MAGSDANDTNLHLRRNHLIGALRQAGWARGAAVALALALVSALTLAASGSAARGPRGLWHVGQPFVSTTVDDPLVVGSSWYQNPVSGSSPDPFALSDGGSRPTYYLYSTGGLIAIQRSRNLVNWTPAGSAFLRRPRWVVANADWHAWSPTVIQAQQACPLKAIRAGERAHRRVGSSCYYLFYTGLSAKFATNCVAVATSISPLGPFVGEGPLRNGTVDNLGRPIGCGDNLGFGNIDPDPFIDTDGQAYLYVSTDWECPPTSAICSTQDATRRPTISVIPLAPSLRTAAGVRVALFSGTEPWEQSRSDRVVEGPWMDKHGGVYHLFFSGGDWTRRYGMGDATLASPTGPAVQDPRNPILSGTYQVFSPGGGSTVTGPDGADWMLYHARLGGFHRPRELFIDRVLWNADGTVRIDGPTTTPQAPAP